MHLNLVLHKLDIQQFSGEEGYAVFGPDGISPGTRARPKFTLTRDEWLELGRPVDISVEVGATAAVRVVVDR